MKNAFKIKAYWPRRIDRGHRAEMSTGETKQSDTSKWDDIIHYVTGVSEVGADFPTSLCGVRRVVEEKYASHSLVEVAFRELAAVCVPLTVLVKAKHGVLQNLSRCPHYNGKMVAIQGQDMLDESAWNEVLSNPPCIALRVRLVNEDGIPFGHLIKVDNSKFLPRLLNMEKCAVKMLQCMTNMWNTETQVIVQVQAESIETKRLAEEYWQNNNSFGPRSDVFAIVSATICIDMVELNSYLTSFGLEKENSTFPLEDPLVLDKVCSFVNCRLAGTHLDTECMLCMEPLRMFKQIRLGCACGEQNGVKGAVVHMKCAMKWLLEQEIAWEKNFNPLKEPSAEGMESPSCPFCMSRLMGTAPYVFQIHQNITDMQGISPASLYESLRFVLVDPEDSFPYALQRLLEGGSAMMRVDQLPEMGINLQDGRRVPFPSAEVLFASLGNGALKEACVIPNLAEALPGQEESIKKDVMYYNNFLYYAGLACELRFSTQHINSQNDH